MEEEKAAAYYDELARKGSGAARFKQGLGFSSGGPGAADPSRGSALPSASSFLSSFVRASSPSKTAELEKQAQLESIQNKLKKKPKEKQRGDDVASLDRVSRDRNSDKRTSRSRSRSRDRHSRRRRSRSRSRSRDDHRLRRRRSRSRSRSRIRDDYRSRRQSRSRDKTRRRRSRSRSRSELSRRNKRSESPRRRPREIEAEKSRKDGKKEMNGGVDYAKMIEGYDKMTPAERVKAKMKFQLTETAENDPDKGTGSNWERFEFDKDAPLDDEELEAVEDDATLVKHIGQSFRFSAVEARREEQIKSAHEEAIFGVPSLPAAPDADDEEERVDSKKDTNDSEAVASLLSDQVLTMQRGSWRDRARKP